LPVIEDILERLKTLMPNFGIDGPDGFRQTELRGICAHKNETTGDVVYRVELKGQRYRSPTYVKITKNGELEFADESEFNMATLEVLNIRKVKKKISNSASKGTILVTGGAGYIGSHAVRRYLEEGWNVVILDSMVKGRRFAIERNKEYAAKLGRTLVFEKGDLLDRLFLEGVFQRNKIDKVVHLAGLIEVGESVARPAIYYYYNVIGTLRLNHAMAAAGVKEIAFASTAAVYASADGLITEETPLDPLSPYGFTKLAMEKIMAEFQKRYDFKWAAMRFFNASGASKDKKIGEAHFPETHVIPRFIAWLISEETVKVFGTDYETPDGTNLRDYIHVLDLVFALILALDLPADKANRAYNLSTGKGTSVLEVLDKVAENLGVQARWQDAGRRPGDRDRLVALADAFKNATGWDLKYSDIDTILKTAIGWYKNMPLEAREKKLLPDFREYDLEKAIREELIADQAISDDLKADILARLERDRNESLKRRYEEALKILKRHNGGHILNGWSGLDNEKKEN